MFVWPDVLKVPPPRKFSRPSGGASSVAFQMEPARNRVHSVASPEPSSISTKQPSASPKHLQLPIPRPQQYQRQRGKNFQRYSTPIFGEDAEEDSRSSKRPSRVIYRKSTLRGFSTMRAGQLVHLIYIDKLTTCNLTFALDFCQGIDESPHVHHKRQRYIWSLLCNGGRS